MKVSALASFKFSRVPSEFLGCARFPFQGFPWGLWVQSGGHPGSLHSGTF